MILRQFVLVAVVLLAAGCAMPAHVRPPRTLDKGEVEHAVGARFSTPPTLQKGHVSLGFPVGEDKNPMGITPVFGLRVGALEWLEVGVEISLSDLRAESSFQLLESRILDLSVGLDLAIALEPPERAHPSSRLGGALPLLAGLNLHRNLSLILMGGPAYWSQGTYAQVGGGIDLRLGSVSLRPTITRMIVIDKEEILYLEDAGDELIPYYGTGPFLLLGLDIAFGQKRGYEGAGIF